jgi:hypothetical protein
LLTLFRAVFRRRFQLDGDLAELAGERERRRVGKSQQVSLLIELASGYLSRPERPRYLGRQVPGIVWILNHFMGRARIG